MSLKELLKTYLAAALNANAFLPLSIEDLCWSVYVTIITFISLYIHSVWILHPTDLQVILV